MIHELIIDGVNGSELGVFLTKVPPITPAPERGSWIEVAGRDGKTWQSDYALDDTKLQLQIYLTPDADIGAVNAWIYGAKTMRVTPYDWFWKVSGAEVAPAYSDWLDMPGNGYTTKDISFVCHPYRYRYPEVARYQVANTSVINNPMRSSAAPIIYVTYTGTGDASLMIGRYTLLLDHFTGTMKIDCEEMMATNAAGTVLMNQYVTAGGVQTDSSGRLRRWPLLKPGYNTITWTGNIYVEIEPRWRER